METQTQPLSPERRETAAQVERSLEILDAAVLTFAAHGYNQTDVQEIADRVGVGKGTVYRHFGNKEALFLAAVAHARDKLIAAAPSNVGAQWRVDRDHPAGSVGRSMTRPLAVFRPGRSLTLTRTCRPAASTVVLARASFRRCIS